MRGDGKTIERRFGEKNAAKVVERSTRSKTTTLAADLRARHPPHRRARRASAGAGVRVDGRARAASLEQLQSTNEIGPVLAESVRSWLDEPRNRELLDRLRAAGVRMEVPESEERRTAAAATARRERPT